ALHVMGLNPVKFLVVPKFLAMLVAVPCAAVLSMLLMIAGGFFISVYYVCVDAGVCVDQTLDALELKDFVTGMVKSVFFALVICWVGVFRGFQVEGGAEGVGRQTTSSVVTSILFIIFVDLVWTVLF